MESLESWEKFGDLTTRAVGPWPKPDVPVLQVEAAFLCPVAELPGNPDDGAIRSS